ncbi:transporter [Wenjunlia vitaminophila]|uniref:Transporter n=1 Tax=Wenjunlia vitaminophila TaxID=76728 RepID=A0A0T6LN78_WENVI|nr:phage holin family protein [Wenjunlia vitaminophila]KRV47565.1 transporter [Wenjunlia vitaminophila]
MTAADNGSAPTADHSRMDSSFAALVTKATVEISDLVHDEIALAKAELRRDAKWSGIVGGALAVVGVLVAFALPVLSFAAAYGLHALGLGLGWSFLIVGSGYLLVALVVALFAARAVKRITFARRSIASVKETAATLRTVRPRSGEPQP